MKAWKKGAIVGVIWGIVSGLIPLLIFQGLEFGTIWRIILLPLTLFFLGITRIPPYNQPCSGDCFHGLQLIPLGAIFIPIIGALVGSILGVAIEKYKRRRAKK